MNIQNQFAWSVSNVVGHSIDPYADKIDDTEGFGAFDSIGKIYNLGVRIIDIGGGEHDYNQVYVDYKYGSVLRVYDPYMRSAGHNKEVLEEIQNRPFDTCTSISVLNVINNYEARQEHIKTCYKSIKEGGKVFFKVWPGNGTGIQEIKRDSYQSNKGLIEYLPEIEKIFGDKVLLDTENNVIVAKKIHPY